jgi:ComF family protein
MGGSHGAPAFAGVLGARGVAAQAVLDLFVPDACHGCGRGRPRHRRPRRPPLSFLAEPISVVLPAGFRVHNHPFCDRCLDRFRPADRAVEIGSYDASGRVITRRGDVFGAARSQPPARPLWLAAPFSHCEMSLKTIRLIKFAGRRSLIPPAARAAAWAVRCFLPPHGPGTVVVPVPMDRRSRRRRGFNQSEVLGEEMSRGLGVPFCAEALEKSVRTPPQSKTPGDRRATNVRTAFACADPSAVAGRDVILVDDLVTTGATAAACASALALCGARSVAVACFARGV